MLRNIIKLQGAESGLLKGSCPDSLTLEPSAKTKSSLKGAETMCEGDPLNNHTASAETGNFSLGTESLASAVSMISFYFANAVTNRHHFGIVPLTCKSRWEHATESLAHL